MSKVAVRTPTVVARPGGVVFDLRPFKSGLAVRAVYFYDIDSKEPVQLWKSLDIEGKDEYIEEIANACFNENYAEADRVAAKAGLAYVELVSSDESLCIIYET